MRRVAVKQGSPLQVVFHQEETHAAEQQTVQTTMRIFPRNLQGTKLIGRHRLQVARSEHLEVALLLPLSEHPLGHLAALDVELLEFGQFSDMLEHVLVLEDDAEVHLLQDVFHAAALYDREWKRMSLVDSCWRRLKARIMLASPIV